jgi:hypothetical protein
LKDNSAVHDTAVPVFSAEGNRIALKSLIVLKRARGIESFQGKRAHKSAV